MKRTTRNFVYIDKQEELVWNTENSHSRFNFRCLPHDRRTMTNSESTCRKSHPVNSITAPREC